MNAKELERFNRGNELNDWIKHYKHQKSVMLSKRSLTIRVEESYGDQNKSTIHFCSNELKRDELFNKGIRSFFDTIINGLEMEFRDL